MNEWDISNTRIIVDDVLMGLFKANKHNELVLTNKDVIKNIKGIFLEIIKRAADLIFTGSRVFKLQIPIRMCAPKFQVFSSCEFFSNLDFLHKFCETTNKLEKFKLVIAFVISNFIYKLFSAKPYNPMLGETFQRTYADNTKIYSEHIIHESPCAVIYLVN